MRVCYFGEYAPNYARNWVIRTGLATQGVEVVPCQVPLASTNGRLRLYHCLLQRFTFISGPLDALFVAEINHAVMPLAWLLARRHRLPIVFDPFVSRYDSLVLDRKQIAQRSWRAGYLYLSDRISMNLADHVLADTHQHRLYYQEKLGVIRPITVVPIGANPQIFHPVSNAAQVTKKKSSPFQVAFWGKFIPLQGVQYILQAAHILEQQVAPVRFSIYGTGQTFAEMQRLARELNLMNVTFCGFIPMEQLPQHIWQADVTLGIFGDTEKARRVVPNKVYEGLAMAKPVITGDSPAIREFFTPGEHLHTVPMADPEALAEAILNLARDEEYRRHLAQQGYKHFQAHFTPEHIGRRVKKILEQLV